MGEQWLCAWCGANLEPLQTGWTDVESRSGEYCPDGQAVRDWGTSPHLPVRAEAAALPAAPAPLAVERLALAVHALQWPEDHEHPEFNVRDDVPCWEIAQRLAAAYAEGEQE